MTVGQSVTTMNMIYIVSGTCHLTSAAVREPVPVKCYAVPNTLTMY